MAANDAGALQAFRRQFHSTLTRWGDALFELTDAVLCATGPMHSVPRE